MLLTRSVIFLLSASALLGQAISPRVRSNQVELADAANQHKVTVTTPAGMPWDLAGTLTHELGYLAEGLRTTPDSVTSFLPGSVAAGIGDGAAHPLSGGFWSCSVLHAIPQFAATIPASGCDLSMDWFTLGMLSSVAAHTNGVIGIPPGTYVTTAPIVISAPISIEGAGSASTIIKTSGDFPAFAFMGCGTPTSPMCSSGVLSGLGGGFVDIGGGGLRKLQISGDGSEMSHGSETKPAIYLAYMFHGMFSDVRVSFWGGDAWYLRSVFDSSFYSIFNRWDGGGVAGTANWHMVSYNDSNPNNSVNEIKVVAGDNEGHHGAFIISDGPNNNSLRFEGTKFETNPSNTTICPIQLVNTLNVQITQAEFNRYFAAPGMVCLQGALSTVIRGKSFNDSFPSQFAVLTDANDVEIQVSGINAGPKPQRLGNTQGVYGTVRNTFASDPYFYLLATAPLTDAPLDSLGGYLMQADTGTPSGRALVGPSVDNASQVEIALAESPISVDGATVYFYLRSSTSKVYTCGVREGSTFTSLVSWTVGTSYGLYPCAVPHQHLSAGAKAVVVSGTGQSGIVLATGRIYYEAKYYVAGTACPDSDGTSFTWSQGDNAYWPRAVAAASYPQACQCITAGAPGVWRRLDAIDPAADNNLAGIQTFSGIAQFTQNILGLYTGDGGITYQSPGAISFSNIATLFHRLSDGINSYWAGYDGTTFKNWWRSDWAHDRVIADLNVLVNGALTTGSDLTVGGNAYLGNLNLSAGMIAAGAVQAAGLSITGAGSIYTAGSGQFGSLSVAGSPVTALTAGPGISISGGVITNTEPFTGLTAGTGISISGSVISFEGCTFTPATSTVRLASGGSATITYITSATCP